MESRRIYSFEDLIAMDTEEIARLVLALQDEAAQSLFALEDTTRRYAEQAREKDARIARLEEENAAISKENEILKAALGDRKAIIKVRNHERYGRGTENLKVLLSGILPGMDEKEKAGILDHLEKLLGDKSIQDESAGTVAAESQDNSQGTEGKDAVGETVPGPDGQDPSGETGKGQRGRKDINREPGFISRYFQEGVAVVFKIDGFTYTADEVRKRFGLKDIDELVYLCSDIEVYETAEVIPAIALRTCHISLKLKRNVDDINITLCGQHQGRLFHNAGICSPSILAYIITQKFVNGTTYYRIESILSSMHLTLKRPTFIGWVEKAAQMLSALPRYMLRWLKKHKVIQIDETFDTVTHDERGSGKASYFWILRVSECEDSDQQVALYFFEQTRSAIVPEYYLHDYSGRVMSDGYVAYKTLTKKNGEIVRCVCLVHGRRFIVKSFIGSDAELRAKMASKDGVKSLQNIDITSLEDVDEAQKVELWGWIALLIISEMFRIEKKLKDLSPEQRLRGRIKEMKPLADELLGLIDLVKGRPNVLANSYAREAVSYFDNNREALQEIFKDGCVPLSNNAAERQAISLALGRNSWKAHDTVKGAETTALMYTLVETAKANGANPYLYIRFLLDSIQDIWDIYRDRLEESDRYEEKKRRRFRAALERLREHPGQDPELDMAGLGEEPDLSFLECLMPWSEEFKAYALAQEADLAQMIADAITRDGLEKMPVTRDAFKKITGSKSKGEKEQAAKDALKKAAEEMGGEMPAAGRESEPGSPVKGVILPKARKPFCYSLGNGTEPAHTENGTGTVPEEEGMVMPSGSGEAGGQEPDAGRGAETEEGTGGYGCGLVDNYAKVPLECEKRVWTDGLSMPSCSGNGAEQAHKENGTRTVPEKKGMAVPSGSGKGGSPEPDVGKGAETEEETGRYGCGLGDNHARMSWGYNNRVRPEKASMPSCAGQRPKKNNSGCLDRGHPPDIAAMA